MAKTVIPLREVSIEELFCGSEPCTYEIPIYQRNYAWEKDEITTLVQDIYDAYRKKDNKPYYIGTLVSYHKGDRVFEVIDGQQRLTTLKLMLEALGIQSNNQLTYRARKKSDETLKSIPEFKVEEKDSGIEYGYKYAKAAIDDLVPGEDLHGFISYFKSNVHIIHYQVPKDIDLNHYFEIMNSRGEQLEKHEIVKAKLMEKLDDNDEHKVFNCIWEGCAEMSVYVQQNLTDFHTEDIFGKSLYSFIPESFLEILDKYREKAKEDGDSQSREKEKITIEDIIRSDKDGKWAQLKGEGDRKDRLSCWHQYCSKKSFL